MQPYTHLSSEVPFRTPTGDSDDPDEASGSPTLEAQPATSESYLICRSKTDGQICDPTEIALGNAWDHRVGGFAPEEGDVQELARDLGDEILDLGLVPDLPEDPGAMIADGLTLLTQGQKLVPYARCRTSNLVCVPRTSTAPTSSVPSTSPTLASSPTSPTSPPSSRPSRFRKIVRELFPSAEASSHPQDLEIRKKANPRGGAAETYDYRRVVVQQSGQLQTLSVREERDHQLLDPEEGQILHRETTDSEESGRIYYLPPKDRFQGTQWDRYHITYPKVNPTLGQITYVRGSIVDRAHEEVSLPTGPARPPRQLGPIYETEYQNPPPSNQTYDHLCAIRGYFNDHPNREVGFIRYGGEYVPLEELKAYCELDGTWVPPEGEVATFPLPEKVRQAGHRRMAYFIPPQKATLALQNPERYRVEYPRTAILPGKTTYVCGKLVETAPPLTGHQLYLDSIRQTSHQYLPLFQQQVVDFILERPNFRPTDLAETIYVSHPVTRESFALRVPYEAQIRMMHLQGLTRQADGIQLWLREHQRRLQGYLGSAHSWDQQLFLAQHRHQQQLQNLPSIPALSGGQRYLAIGDRTPASYFDPGNPSGFTSEIPLGEGVSIRYQGQARPSKNPGEGGRGRGGGSKKVGGWEIAGTLLLTFTIKLGGSGGACCIM